MNDQNTILKNYFLFSNSVKDEYNVEDVKNNSISNLSSRNFST